MSLFTEEELEIIEKKILNCLKELKRTSRADAKKIIEEAIESAVHKN